MPSGPVLWFSCWCTGGIMTALGYFQQQGSWWFATLGAVPRPSPRRALGRKIKDPTTRIQPCRKSAGLPIRTCLARAIIFCAVFRSSCPWPRCRSCTFFPSRTLRFAACAFPATVAFWMGLKKVPTQRIAGLVLLLPQDVRNHCRGPLCQRAAAVPRAGRHCHLPRRPRPSTRRALGAASRAADCQALGAALLPLAWCLHEHFHPPAQKRAGSSHGAPAAFHA